MKRTSPYDAANHEYPEEHAIDRVIEQRIPLKGLRREIRATTAEMIGALGERKALWCLLEEQLGDYRAQREEAYFNLGYEHGVAAGRANALRAHADASRAASVPAQAYIFADTIRNLAVQATLPRPLTVMALLETAWALTVALLDNEPTGQDREVS